MSAPAKPTPLELYEEELRDFREQLDETLGYEHSGEKPEARAVWLSEGHWRCILAFLEAALSTEEQVPGESSREDP